MKRAKLQAARYRKGLSQEALAEQIGVSRTAIGQWENGHTTPYPLYVGKLCVFFGVDDPAALDLQVPQNKTSGLIELDSQPIELRPYDDSSSLSREERQYAGVQGSSVGQMEDETIRLSYERHKNIRTLEAGIHFMKETRRHLLQRLLNFAESVSVAPYALPNIARSQQFAEALARPINIDESTLTHLETITRSHWHLFLHASAKGDLLSGFLGHLQTILQFLNHTQPGATRNRLYSLAGESAQMMGAVLFDLQDYPYAQTYYQFSIQAAKEAGNNPLRAVGLGRLSFLPIYRNEPLQACTLLQEAHHILTYSPRPKISSWLAVVEAETMAHLQKEVACEEALEQATTAYTQEGSTEDFLWTQLNDATIPGYKGACYLRLQQGRKAYAALKETLPYIPEYSPRHSSIILADMAAAMLQMEEVEQACTLLRQALEITQHTKSLMVLTRMHRVRNHLMQWNDTPAVKELDQYIEDVLPHIIS